MTSQFKYFIKKVNCGNEHCCCLTKNYQVLAWGSNKFSQLGIPNNNKPVNIPTKLCEFDNAKPYKVTWLL